MNDKEKKLPSRSNTWKTWKNKLKNLGYAGAISSVLLLSSCGVKTSDVTKASQKYDNAIEKVEDKKENLKNKEEALKKAQEELQKARQELIEAQKEAAEAKKEVKQESSKL